MKKIVGLLLAVIMIAACFAVTASAEGETNYALTATYTAESTNENLYGLSDGRGDDSAHTKLNDGFSGFDECTGIDNVYDPTGEGDKEKYVTVNTENTSVCYTGTYSEITLTWDLGEVKDDISRINFLNCRCDFEWADDNQFDDYVNYIWDAYSRSFQTDAIVIKAAGEDGSYEAVEGFAVEEAAKDNPYTEIDESSDIKLSRQRDISVVFAAALQARYLQITVSPARYVLSLDEVQIMGGAAASSETESASSATESKASESAAQSETDPVSEQSESSETASESASAAESEASAANTDTQASAPAKDDTPKTGDSNLIFFIALAGVALVGAVIFKKVKS